MGQERKRRPPPDREEAINSLAHHNKTLQNQAPDKQSSPHFEKLGAAVIIEISSSFIVGAALGLRFKAFILVPTVILGLLVIAIVGTLRGDSWWFVGLATVLVTTALQIGYFAGIVARQAIVARKPGGGANRNEHPSASEGK
jgi:hypothetical protein